MFDRIVDSFKNNSRKTVIRGLIIAFIVDIVYNLFGMDNNFIKYFLIILLIVITMPGMVIFKRK
jgi:lipopolysaccharide/colanic/teichoic acid biosynthesis glycosyltransferase